MPPKKVGGKIKRTGEKDEATVENVEGMVGHRGQNRAVSPGKPALGEEMIYIYQNTQ